MSEEIVNCDFVFKCPRQWEKMDVTGVAGVRFCSECKKDVHFVGSPERLEQLSREGKCVAVLQRIDGDGLQDKYPDLVSHRPPEIQITAGIPVRTDKILDRRDTIPEPTKI